MNKIFLHLWLFTLGSSILYSCTQNEAVPDVESQDQENAVVFQTNEGASRAFIDGNLSTTNTTMCIYGYKKDVTSGEEVPLGKGDKALVGKTLKCLDGTTWAVVDNTDNPITYFWEGEGRYRFFGWLTHDAASGKAIPTGLTPTCKESKLSIPATVINKDYSQFDFLYSNINHREMTSENMNVERRKSVSMDMNHLLSAFAIGIKNTSEDDIVIKSVQLNCVHDQGSVNIDLSQNVTANIPTGATSSISPFVEYGTTSKATSESFLSFSGSHTLTKRTGYLPNIFNPSDTEKQFYMVWPQDGDVLNATSLTFADEEAEAAAPDASFPIVLQYTANGVSSKKRMRLPNEDWEPGKKYYLEVLIADKLVEITTTVRDWDYTDAKVDFSDSAILVEEDGHLRWDVKTCIVDHTKKEVYVKGGMPVEGTFIIDAPQGGQWRVSLEGDVTAFRIIDDATPTDDGFGPIDGEVHRIKIVPQITTPDRDYRVTLKFVAITADHKTYPADDMLQDSNNDDKADIYTVVLEKVK